MRLGAAFTAGIISQLLGSTSVSPSTYHLLKEIKMYHIKFLFSICLLVFALSANGQVSTITGSSGDLTVQVKITDSDPDKALYKALSMAAKAIPAKENSTVALLGKMYIITYSDTKYTLKLGTEVLLHTTQVAAVRTYIVAHCFRAVTGKELKT